MLVVVTVCVLRLAHCSLLPGLGGLVAPPLDTLGYVPLEAALATCEAGARRDLEQEIARLQRSGQLQEAAREVGADLEARCRSYAEYAGRQCGTSLNGRVASLEARGRSLLGSETARCGEEVGATSQLVADQEQRRLQLQGEREAASLRAGYEAQGRVVEAEVFADFERRGAEVRARVTREFERRGAEEQRQIVREFELRGAVEMASIELQLRRRGEAEARQITAEFEARGAALNETITRELVARGEMIMAQVEKELRERGRRLQIEGEDACTDMIAMACEDVVEDSESGEFCDEFLFFTGSLDRKRRKTFNSFRLQLEAKKQ